MICHISDLTSHLRSHDISDLMISDIWLVSCHEYLIPYMYLCMPTAGLHSTHSPIPHTHLWHVMCHESLVTCHISDLMISQDLKICQDLGYLQNPGFRDIWTSRDLRISRHVMSWQKWSKMDHILTCWAWFLIPGTPIWDPLFWASWPGPLQRVGPRWTHGIPKGWIMGISRYHPNPTPNP